MSSAKYQEIMTAKWHEDCRKWQGHPHPFPHLGMYGFHRQYGYVAFQGRFSMWRRTKKEVIAAFEKSYGKNGCEINE